jgi:hypothetical protein
MTRLERENKWLAGGWSQASRNRALKRIDEAAALTQDFIAYNGQESPICATSLGLIIAELQASLDDVQRELTSVRRTLEDG